MADDIDPFFSDRWPPFRGDYSLGDPLSGVAVLTLASRIDLKSAAIFGPCVTENLGIEKVIANIVSNPYIRYLIVCGSESQGHLPGDAIIALHRNGLDANGRIIGAKGAIPFIQNIPLDAVSRFRDQVDLLDKRGVLDPALIDQLVLDLSYKKEPYREPPISFIKARPSRNVSTFGHADIIIGCGVGMDVSAWLVMTC